MCATTSITCQTENNYSLFINGVSDLKLQQDLLAEQNIKLAKAVTLAVAISNKVTRGRIAQLKTFVVAVGSKDIPENTATVINQPEEVILANLQYSHGNDKCTSSGLEPA